MDIRKFCDKTIRVETETDDDNENAARKPKLTLAQKSVGTERDTLVFLFQSFVFFLRTVLSLL